MTVTVDRVRHEDRIPPSAVSQLRSLCTLLRNSLSTLEAVILHGSAATTGFEPARSDLDVLAIVTGEPDSEELRQAGREILAISCHPHPAEISIVSSRNLTEWRHPCPHLLHFGEEHRPRFKAGDFTPASQADADLAMHFVVARARGIELLGNSKLPVVPRSDFLAAILSDLEWAEQHGEALQDYMVSNACRTLAYLREGAVLSKPEGRHWCAAHGIQTASVVDVVKSELYEQLEM